MFNVNASACGRILVALMKYIQAHKKKLLGVTISNTLILISLSVDKFIYLCKTEYYFIVHTFYLI